MRAPVLCALGVLLVLGQGVPALGEDGAWDEEEAEESDEAGDGPDDAPPPAAEALAPYGDWVDYASYGRVWRPVVAVGWRPYLYGHWAWSAYGWTWVSLEPWGCTFHYGRWAFVPVGWVWVPGTVWGPAWVDWTWGDGFVGWAPLAPAVTHVTVVDRYVFVRERDFSHRQLPRVAVDHRHVPTHVVHGWPHRRVGGPSHDHIVRVADEPVRRWQGHPRRAGGRSHGDQQPGETFARRTPHDQQGGRFARPMPPDGGGHGWKRSGPHRRIDHGDGWRHVRKSPRVSETPAPPPTPALHVAHPIAPPAAATSRRQHVDAAPPSVAHPRGGGHGRMRVMPEQHAGKAPRLDAHREGHGRHHVR